MKKIELYGVFVKDGRTRLIDDQGKIFPHEVNGILENPANGDSFYTVTLAVRVFDSEEEAINFYTKK